MTIDDAGAGRNQGESADADAGAAGAAAVLSQPPKADAAREGAGGDAANGKADGQGTDDAWLKTLPDELQQMAKAKGWKGAADALGSYASLEKAYGAEKAGRPVVVLPKDDAPPEAWDEVWQKLGRPEAPEGYELAKGEGVDADFAEWAGGAFLKAGLNRRQAETLKAEWEALQTSMVESETRQFEEASKADFSALKKEWGKAFDDKVELGRRFAAKAGFQADELGAIERVLGTRALLERFAEMGAKLGEDVLPGGAAAGGEVFGDAGSAVAEIEALKADKAFQKRVREGDREAREKWDRLHQVAYGEAS